MAGDFGEFGAQVWQAVWENGTAEGTVGCRRLAGDQQFVGIDFTQRLDAWEQKCLSFRHPQKGFGQGTPGAARRKQDLDPGEIQRVAAAGQKPACERIEEADLGIDAVDLRRFCLHRLADPFDLSRLEQDRLRWTRVGHPTSDDRALGYS